MATQSLYEKIRGHFLLSRLNVKGIFARSVVWIYEFSEKSGARGLILNRPIGRTLGECAPVFAGTSSGSVPVFEGGPVEPGKLCFLIRSRVGTDGNYSVRVGVRLEEVRDVFFNPGVCVYGFAGRAEWARGQLENEIARGTWMRAKMDPKIWDRFSGEEFWRQLVAKIRKPECELMLRAPEDLSQN